MRSRISSRTTLNTARRSSSSPVAREGSLKDQRRRLCAPGKTGHASLAASQTVTTSPDHHLRAYGIYLTRSISRGFPRLDP